MRHGQQGLQLGVVKGVTFRRGTQFDQTTVSRAPGKELDDLDRAELDAILADVESMYRL